MRATRATYLKVKLRKNEPVARSEYADLRDRIDNIRTRARGDATGAMRLRAACGRSAPPATDRPAASARRTKCRSAPSSTSGCRTRSSSATAQVEDRFEATTLVDLTQTATACWCPPAR